MTIDIERVEQSKDPRLRRFLATAVTFLEESGLRWAAFGSCAVFAHRGSLRRLTRDLDVILPREDFERLEAAARQHGFEAARERDHFVRLRHDIFQVHAVPEIFHQFDYRSGETLAAVDIGVDWHRLERRELRFVTGPAPLELPVPSAATLLMLALLRPLNANSFDDLRGLLTTPGLDPNATGPFVTRNPALGPLVATQLERLAALLAETRPRTNETNETDETDEEKSLVAVRRAVDETLKESSCPA